MQPDLIECFHDSLQRCQQEPQFLHRFYQKLWIADPRIPQLFKDTDMRRQEMMLRASLHMVMLASQSNNAAEQYLRHIAQEHRKRGITAELFEIWLECLVRTVAITDPRYNQTIDTAWRTVMSHGVAYMKAQMTAPSPDENIQKTVTG